MTTPKDAAKRLAEDYAIDDVDGAKATGVSRSTADKLIELIESEPAVFFKDQLGDAYCAPLGDGSWVIRVQSDDFKKWLRRHYWVARHKSLGKDTVETTASHFDAVAQFEGDEIPLDVRVARRDESVWYDLGGSAVEITETGWRVDLAPPILFKRYKSQSKQIEPVSGGTVDEFLKFVLVPAGDELLMLVRLITSFIPGFPHPIEVVSGDQGSAKSFYQKLQKDLVDPSPVSSFGPPKDMKEFLQQASHHWFVVLDNLSYLKADVSDALYRLCTGEGGSKRVLYKDDDDFLYQMQRVVAFNGVNNVVDKPDLLDRSVLVSLERVPDNERKEEEELLNQYRQAKPRILGAIFTVIAKALELRPGIALKSPARLADFVRWGEAVSQTLGHPAGALERAYRKNVSRQNDAAIAEAPVGDAIVLLMEGRDVWEGTASDLLKELEAVATPAGVDVGSHKWPNAANALWRRVKEVRPNLIALGIKANNYKSGTRRITLTRISSEEAVLTAQTVQPDPEGGPTAPYGEPDLDGSDSSDGQQRDDADELRW